MHKTVSATSNVQEDSTQNSSLRTAHSVPMAGHLGWKKTMNRMLKRFFWPGIYVDVQELCRTCPECQRVACHHKHKAPLMPLPVVDQLFERVGIDLARLSPQTKAGHRCVLTIVDYETRYPEAIPLHQTDSQTIAAELMTIFSRIRVLKEILSDCGANLTSKLIKELYRLLGVQPIRTSPYHPQTDGMVERFHSTMKTMIRKILTKFDMQWDKALPYILFTYREVPTETTGFSPFEMLYGKRLEDH